MQRQAAEAAQGEARVLRERCSQQRAALSQQQDKENQWKVRQRGGCSWAVGLVSCVIDLHGGLGRHVCRPASHTASLPVCPAPKVCKPSLHPMAACPLTLCAHS